jgi:hypothetical protein
MEKETNLSAQESLKLIEQMINTAKNRFSNNSFLYLLWGWVIFICSMGHFILLTTKLIQRPEKIWLLIAVAIITQIIYAIKYQKKEQITSYADEILSYVWTCFGIAITVLSIIAIKNNNWIIFYPTILMLYGIPTFLSGAIMKFLPLKIGGIVCWILAIVALFVKPIYLLLLVGIAVLTAWIIPGYLLKKLHQQQAL